MTAKLGQTIKRRLEQPTCAIRLQRRVFVRASPIYLICLVANWTRSGRKPAAPCTRMGSERFFEIPKPRRCGI